MAEAAAKPRTYEPLHVRGNGCHAGWGGRDIFRIVKMPETVTVLSRSNGGDGSLGHGLTERAARAAKASPAEYLSKLYPCLDSQLGLRCREPTRWAASLEQLRDAFAWKSPSRSAGQLGQQRYNSIEVRSAMAAGMVGSKSRTWRTSAAPFSSAIQRRSVSIFSGRIRKARLSFKSLNRFSRDSNRFGSTSPLTKSLVDTFRSCHSRYGSCP